MRKKLLMQISIIVVRWTKLYFWYPTKLLEMNEVVIILYSVEEYNNGLYLQYYLIIFVVFTIMSYSNLTANLDMAGGPARAPQF